VRVKGYVVTRKGVTRLVCFIEHLDTRPWVILLDTIFLRITPLFLHMPENGEGVCTIR
jgi:hypothetical protein